MNSLSSLLAMAGRERKIQQMCSFNGKPYVNFNDGHTGAMKQRLRERVTQSLTQILSTSSRRGEFGKKGEGRRGSRQAEEFEGVLCVPTRFSISRKTVGLVGQEAASLGNTEEMSSFSL